MKISMWRSRVPTLAMATAAASIVWTMPSVLSAQPASPLSIAQAAEQRTFDIPAQPLGTALGMLGQQSGRQVTVDGAVVRNLATPGVQGTMTIDQALTRLLAGTGLTYAYPSSTTITVHRIGSSGGNPTAVQLDPVQVQGYPVPAQAMIDNLPPPYAGGQVATGGQLGLFGNRGVMDTPFNQTSYTAQKAQDQQAKTVRDVLIDDPSVRTWGPDGTPGGDNLWIRGFNVSTENAAYGGLYGMLPSFTIMPEMAERIEVLKGPSAMLTGMPPNNNSIGGTINVVPKRAPSEDLTQVTANYASVGQVGGHADIARRFGPDKQFGVRFNGVFRAGQTEVENNTDKRGLAVLGLDFRGERVRLSADLGYQYQYIGGVIAALGVDDGVPLPWAPRSRMNPGQPWGYRDSKDLFGVVRAEVDLADRLTAYAAFGAHDFRSSGLYSAILYATDFNGAAASTGPVNRSQWSTSLTAEAGLRGSADTGPIGHEFALTATTFVSASANQAVRGSADFASNFYNPTIIAPPSIPTPAANKTASQSLSNWGIADTLSVAEKRVQLTVGARLQQVTAANFAAVTGMQTSNYDQSALSPSVSLVLKPWQNVSVYGNWIQGLQQGIIVQAPFANAGEIFPPYKSTQYEAGVKVDWGRFTTTASVFQIAQPSILTNVATNTQFLGGEQVNQGLEFNVFGEPIEGVRLLGGAMFLNAVLSKTQGGLTDGWIAPFAPGFSLNLAGEWDLPFARGATVNGRVVYTGSQYIDTTFPRRALPDWTRFDLGARYAFDNPGAKGKLVVARFEVENVLDANYWAGGGGSFFLNVGAPRTFRLSLTADF